MSGTLTQYMYVYQSCRIVLSVVYCQLSTLLPEKHYVLVLNHMLYTVHKMEKSME